MQQWYCDVCDGTLFEIAPKLTGFGSRAVLRVDGIGVGMYAEQGCAS